MKNLITDWFKALMTPKIKIVDVILHKNQYYTQRFVVLNRLPKFLYEGKDRHLVAEDSGFYRFYLYEPRGQAWKAFGGRKFTIPLKNGEIIEAVGQYWDNVPPEFSGIFQGGFATLKGLSRCNVYCSYYFTEEVEQKIEKWLKKHKASNNYLKYDTNSKNYMVQTIVSRFE